MTGFEIVDLDDNAQAVYRAVVTAQPVTLPRLGEMVGMAEARLSGIVERLRTSGLVARAAGQPTRLVAAPPEIAMEALLLDKEEQVKRARLAMQRLIEEYHRSTEAGDPAHLVEVVSGQDAVFQRFQQMQRASKREIRIIDKPPYAAPDSDANVGYERELLERGVSWRVIYDPGGLVNFHRLAGDVQRSVMDGEQARVLPAAPLKLVLSDHRLGMIPLQAEPDRIDSIVVVYRSALLEAMSMLFEQLWERAMPLSLATGDPGERHPGGPSEIERQMLSLMTAGLSDERIASRMDMSLRTTQRRLRELLDKLGAHTRFQAGVRATTMGWIPAESPEVVPETGTTAEDGDSGADAGPPE